MKNIFTTVLLLLGFLVGVSAKENIGWHGKKAGPKGGKPKSAQACDPANGRTDLDINNVRAQILTGGDMWWDLNSNPRYEVPKGSGRHSSFAASLWIGGLDQGGNLKVAAQTYRQTGNDFWPGPLDTITASITNDICTAYDKHWKITKQEVIDFVLSGGTEASESILTWPGNGDFDGLNQGKYLAPFIDLNGNGIYEPLLGEYPGYDINGSLGCDAKLFGDQTLWWVFNDKGNIHTETGGFPLGIEIRAQAFAFATNNSLNNMTFYAYEIINRSTVGVEECYFGKWIDSDIGFYNDDFVGCDVEKGLGYTYNGDNFDEGAFGYGANPPAFGVDFFEGPFKDANNEDDSADPCVEPKAINGLGFGDGIVDNERIGMSKFVYYNNDFTIIGNPENAQHIYNYLRGRWKDGTPIIYGGNGYGAGTRTNFMFPGNTDPLGIGQFLKSEGVGSCLPQTPWDETSAGNPPADRRFLQSAGPFTLQAGAFNTITVGAVWARASSGGNLASVALVRQVDDDAQALFNNCFSIINGPDAPFVKIVELSNELIFLLESDSTIINYQDTTAIPGFGDVIYRFQGYQIFQLKDLSVTVADLKDLNRARLVAQCDVKDGVTQLVNRYFDQNLNANIPVEEVNGEDKGIRHSFRFTTDAFALGDPRLVNHRTYFYLVLAYANAINIPDTLVEAFNEPYLAGRKTKGFASLQVYSAVPHIPSPAFGGTIINAPYGGGPKLTRIEGYGNLGNVLDLTQESINQILQPPYFMERPVFENARGPVAVRVVDPRNVPNGDFELRFDNINNNARWTLTRLNSDDAPVSAQTNLINGYEQVIGRWGLSISAIQTVEPGVDVEGNNGILESTAEFADNSRRWLNYLTDIDGAFEMNWIRSGSQTFPTGSPDVIYNDYIDVDPNQAYEKIIDGAWAPYRMASFTPAGPGYNSVVTNTLSNLNQLHSVDIVLTPNKDLWSRCPVFETNDNPATSQGGAAKGDLRRAPSVDKNGNPDGTGTGFGWFPGYAINIETGERLNIAFGENSRLTEDNGRDMLFNPSSRTWSVFQNQLQYFFGGMHFIYVFGSTGTGNANMSRYDEGQLIGERLANPSAPQHVANKRNVWRNCLWTSIPLSVPTQPFLNNEYKVRIRVTKPMRFGHNAAIPQVQNPENNNRPFYRFNTGDIATTVRDLPTESSSLALINVVPNPYYAFSAYERGQLDNRVKIVNLPQNCKIRIYTSNGSLVRTFNKADTRTSLDWDLRNQAGIPIASGIYILHIDAGEAGERVVKWLGVMRPIDLDTF